MLFGIALLLFGIYRWTQDPTSWPLTAIAFGFVGLSSNASDRIEAYRQWKRAWDDMQDRPARSPRRRVRDAIVLLAGTGALIAREVFKLPISTIVLGLLTALGCFLLFQGLRKLVRRRRATREATTELVSVCINEPVLPVPSIGQAFKDLPGHCHSVLRPRASTP